MQIKLIKLFECLLKNGLPLEHFNSAVARQTVGAESGKLAALFNAEPFEFYLVNKAIKQRQVISETCKQ